jgi:RNA polymerase sigma factor (sigma-70 family)
MAAQHHANSSDLFYDRQRQVEAIQNYQATIPKGSEYGNVSILNGLYEAHKGSIRKSAIHWSHITKLDVEDLEQEGYFAFLKAAEQFDPNRGTMFNTYLLIKCRQHMTIEGPQQVGSVSMERNTAQKAQMIQQFQSDFYGRHGRFPGMDETAKGTGYSMKTIKGIESQLRTPIYVDGLTEPETAEARSVLETISLRVYPGQADAESQANIESLMRGLDPQEREITTKRYLEDTRNLSHTKLAKIVRLSRSKVYAIDQSALAKMRRRAA